MLSRDKQIEEIVKVLVEGHHKMDIDWTNHFMDSEKFPKPKSEHEILAEALYNNGYRKASDGVWGFDGMGWTCSECGEYALLDKYKQAVHSDFCPNCGAHMKGE